MTLARRMWLASAALALLVGAAFTALILAVSAQREAADRETRSKDVTAASLQLERARLGRRVELPQLRVRPGRTGSLETYRTREPTAARRARRVSRLSCRTTRARVAGHGRSRTQIREYAFAFVPPLVRILQKNTGIGHDDATRSHIRQAADGRDPAALQRSFGADENKLAAQAARDADERTDIAVLVGAVAVGASMALIVLFGIVLARSIGRPVRAVAGGAGRIAGGELSLRLPEEGPGEVGELTRAFNEMAERLEANHAELEQQNEELRESERSKTELVSIVSHELRTPLASVLGFTALLLEARVRRRRRGGTTSASSTRRRAGSRRCSRTSSTCSGSSTRASTWRRRRSTWRASSTSRRSSTPPRARSTGSRSARGAAADRARRPAADWPRSSVTCSRTRSSTRPRAAPSSSSPPATATASGSRSTTRGSGSRRISRAGSSRSSSAATQAPRASPAPASASPSRARSSRRTAAASASTATQAKARPSGSSCRGKTESPVRTPPRRGNEQKGRLAADGRDRRHRRRRPVADPLGGGNGKGDDHGSTNSYWPRRGSTSVRAASRPATRRSSAPGCSSEGRATRSAAPSSLCTFVDSGRSRSCRGTYILPKGKHRRRRLAALPAVLRPGGARRHRPLRQRARNADRHPHVAASRCVTSSSSGSSDRRGAATLRP